MQNVCYEVLSLISCFQYPQYVHANVVPVGVQYLVTWGSILKKTYL